MPNVKRAQNKPLVLVWLRRDLRLYDHAAFAAALGSDADILPVFVFDTDILQDFPNPSDRRVTFIAEALAGLDAKLRALGGGLLALHGCAEKLIPEIVARLGAEAVYAAADYEPATRKRDAAVAEALGASRFITVCDHLIHAPGAVRKNDGSPYLVFTPYSKAWRAALRAGSFDEKPVNLHGRLAACPDFGLDTGSGRRLVEQIGYTYTLHPDWPADGGARRLARFIGHSLGRYQDMRDFMAEGEGTSRLSPYLRFGLLSVRHCARLAVERPLHETWMNELIWREFYAMILYYFPESAHLELVEKYRGLDWSRNEAHWQAFVESRTGYPIVDAAMAQLHETGWMHNRARMIVASFLTKDLHIDWRRGEAHFAQWLMDYDMASNIGGWQWAASTGTDAAPYFRIFNPVTQSRRFDPKGDYIRRWLPALKQLSDKEIHMPRVDMFSAYPAPIVQHDKARKYALAMYQAKK